MYLCRKEDPVGGVKRKLRTNVNCGLNIRKTLPTSRYLQEVGISGERCWWCAAMEKQSKAIPNITLIPMLGASILNREGGLRFSPDLVVVDGGMKQEQCFPNFKGGNFFAGMPLRHWYWTNFVVPVNLLQSSYGRHEGILLEAIFNI